MILKYEIFIYFKKRYYEIYKGNKCKLFIFLLGYILRRSCSLILSFLSFLSIYQRCISSIAAWVLFDTSPAFVADTLAEFRNLNK